MMSCSLPPTHPAGLDPDKQIRKFKEKQYRQWHIRDFVRPLRQNIGPSILFLNSNGNTLLLFNRLNKAGDVASLFLISY